MHKLWKLNYSIRSGSSSFMWPFILGTPYWKMAAILDFRVVSNSVLWNMPLFVIMPNLVLVSPYALILYLLISVLLCVGYNVICYVPLIYGNKIWGYGYRIASYKYFSDSFSIIPYMNLKLRYRSCSLYIYLPEVDILVSVR